MSCLKFSLPHSLVYIHSPSTISNYLAGVRAWHIIHGLKLNSHKPTMDALLKAAIIMSPPDAQRAKRPPLPRENRRHQDPAGPQQATQLSSLRMPHHNLLGDGMSGRIHPSWQDPLCCKHPHCLERSQTGHWLRRQCHQGIQSPMNQDWGYRGRHLLGCVAILHSRPATGTARPLLCQWPTSRRAPFCVQAWHFPLSPQEEEVSQQD